MRWEGRIDSIVFDLDGTLIDSRRDLAGAVNALRRELGLAELSVDRIVTMVGRGARVLVQQALEADSEGLHVPLHEGFDEIVDRAFERFLALYLERCLEETRPYDGVPEMLHALAARFPLALLTNKPERHTRRILAGLGLAGFFRDVLGGDTLGTRKPDPEGLRLLAGRLGTPPDRTLFVGDSAVDAETARAAGTPYALVPWGYGGPGDLADDEPDLRPETPGDLVAALG
ncbi:MAG: HAD-IA family hydrolase [Acidobacteriota bacterium]|jgi:phosphoglycolate phosphatase